MFLATVITPNPNIARNALVLGFITSSSALHSITLPQSQEKDCFVIERT
jgi:hypothetical protein